MIRSSARDETLILSLALSLVCLTWLAAQLPAAEPAEEDPFAEAPADEPAQSDGDDDPFGDQPGAVVRPAAAEPRVKLTQRPAEDARPAIPARTGRHMTSAEAKIRYALHDPTTMEFTETPVQDAVDYLRDLHGIEIQLDTKALEEAGVGGDTPVTRSLKNVTLGAALRLLLSSMDLAYMVKDEVLLITTRDRVDSTYELQVYDVSDLLEDRGEAAELARPLQMLIAPHSAHAVAPQLATGKRDAATATGTGGGMGGGMGGGDSEFRIVPFRRMLLVRASIAQHEQLDEVLDEMQRVANAVK